MNRSQRTIILVALLVTALMLTVPPMKVGYGGISYRFFFQGGTVSQQTIVLQILIIGVLTAVSVLLFGGKRE